MTGSSTRAQKRAINAGLVKRSLTFGSIFLGMNCILPTHKDAAPNLGRFTYPNLDLAIYTSPDQPDPILGPAA